MTISDQLHQAKLALTEIMARNPLRNDRDAYLYHLTNWGWASQKIAHHQKTLGKTDWTKRKTTMTRLHRDAPLEIASPPRFATSAPPVVTWRTDLLQVAIASAVAVGAGLFATLTAVVFWSWSVLGYGLWFTALLALFPFGLLAYMILREMTDRHRLNRVRVQAEERLLLGAWLDTDHDGTLEDDEMTAFLTYVRMLHQGGKTTAAQAQLYGVSGPDWQNYRNVIVSTGLGVIVRNRGGDGFVLRPSIRSQPWDAIEGHIRARAGMLVRSASDPGMLITASPPPTTKRLQVSTLPGDLFDAGNVDDD